MKSFGKFNIMEEDKREKKVKKEKKEKLGNYFYDLPVELQLHIMSFIPRLRPRESLPPASTPRLSNVQ